MERVTTIEVDHGANMIYERDYFTISIINSWSFTDPVWYLGFEMAGNILVFHDDADGLMRYGFIKNSKFIMQKSDDGLLVRAWVRDIKDYPKTRNMFLIATSILDAGGEDCLDLGYWEFSFDKQ